MTIRYQSNFDRGRRVLGHMDNNFVTNLYRGNYSLATTFWLFGLLGSIIVAIATILVISNSIFDKIHEALAPLDLIMYFGARILHPAYLIALTFGLWRSANKYEGPSIWVFLAKCFAIFPVFQAVVLLFPGVWLWLYYLDYDLI